MKVFDGNREKVDAILTLAYFLFTGKGSYHQLASWQRVARMPYTGELTSSAITRLTQSITEQNRMDLLRLRAKRLGNNEFCAVDSTSRSAWEIPLQIYDTAGTRNTFPFHKLWMWLSIR